MIRRLMGTKRAAVLVLVAVFLLETVHAKPLCACTSKVQAWVSTMKSDLRNLMVAQEMFRSDSGRLATTLSEFGAAYHPSADVTIILSAERGANRWSATATHARLEWRCTLTVGYESIDDGAPQCVPPAAQVRAERMYWSSVTVGLAALVVALAAVLLKRMRRVPAFVVGAAWFVNPAGGGLFVERCGEIDASLATPALWFTGAMLLFLAIGRPGWRIHPRTPPNAGT